MKTYTNLYNELCSRENLERAFKKARKRKTKKSYVIEFEKNLDKELNQLQQELTKNIYQPHRLQRFIVRDPKTRVIHASSFRDRVVYHALINVIGPIFEKIFIYDSYAGRIKKGTHKAIARFDIFKRKVSKNGRLLKGAKNANHVKGYMFKADIKHYFETVDHQVLLSIIQRKIKDGNVLWLIKKILQNYDAEREGKGMPLGNYTSQFFANIYLNELDYYVKHKLKVKYYLRYVDDFIIVHENKSILESYKREIERYLADIKLGLHPEKTKIIPLRNGVPLVGYRIFYCYKLLRKRNRRAFARKVMLKIRQWKQGEISKEKLIQDIQGWMGYAQWANTHKLRTKMLNEIL